MATTLKGFAAQMQATANAIVPNTAALMRKVALSVDQTLVQATPVDTGRARSNWIVDVGSIPSGTVPAHAPGAHGSTAAQNTQQALDDGRNAIAKAQAGQSIYIVNNLDYIEALNNGSSRQAPANFVEKAIDAGVSQIKGADITVTDQNGTRNYP